MCNKAVNNYPYSLQFVAGFYKTQKICDKALDTHPFTIKCIPEYYKAQEICEAVNGCFFVFDFIPDL